MEASSPPRYRPLARRGWLAQRWIGITVAFAVAVLGLNAAYLATLGDPEEAAAFGGTVGVWYLVQICFQVLAAGAFVAWLSRAYSNARVRAAMSVSEPLNRPNWLLLRSWWTAWVVTNALVAMRIGEPALDQTRSATIVVIVAEALYVLAAILCIRVTRRITAEQESG
jgi:hypothetical protein